jgi:hypothetical protein
MVKEPRLLRTSSWPTGPLLSSIWPIPLATRLEPSGSDCAEPAPGCVASPEGVSQLKVRSMLREMRLASLSNLN